LGAWRLGEGRWARGRSAASDLGRGCEDGAWWADGSVLPSAHGAGGQLGSADGAAEQRRELALAEPAAFTGGAEELSGVGVGRGNERDDAAGHRTITRWRTPDERTARQGRRARAAR